ncbi:MAG TPA: hypothetical protein VF099_07770 [Ktedonobacterales bacterium]
MGKRGLLGPAGDMAVLCVRLVSAAKARPPQPLIPLLFWLPQRWEQAAQFSHTQPDSVVIFAPFSWSSWA